MADASSRGRFAWHELLTTDPASAERFYTAVFGWGVQPFEHQPSYRMWTVKGQPVGGSMQLTDAMRAGGQKAGWLAYVSTPDVDATVRDATARGASALVPPTDIPNVGRYAVLADPWGATFALFRPAGPPPAGADHPGIGDFTWHELATNNWQAATDFYVSLFGWERAHAMDMGGGNMYQMFGWGGRTMGGIYNKGPNLPVARWLSYVRVPSADAAAAIATRNGGRIVSGPMDVPGGDRIVQFVDPQGIVIAAHALAAVPAEAKTAAKKPAARPKKKAAPKKSKKTAKKKAVKRKPARKSARPARKRTARKPAKKK